MLVTFSDASVIAVLYFGGICTVLKEAQISSPDGSVLPSVIPGPPPGWVKLEVIH